MDGILNINKSPGMTSFDVVARVKRITGERHTGHAGTLDPMATGVLPVCLGQATRVIEFLFDETKTYRAEVKLGITTDTYDSTGKILKTADASDITREMVETVLEKFRGQILQTPPMYSAIKHKGKPLYKLARSGIEVERESRPAYIYRLEFINWRPPVFSLEIVCGKGTYIRSLAHDIGEALGSGAVMTNLIRSRVGPFTIEDAITLLQLEEACSRGQIGMYLYPADYVLSHFNAVVVSKGQQISLVQGSPVTLELTGEAGPSAATSGSRSRAYSEDGIFIGIIRYDAEKNRWQPEKIFWKRPCE